MGCFSTCFPKSNRRKSRRSTKTNPYFDQPLQRDDCVEALQPTVNKEPENTEEVIDPVPDSKDGQGERLSNSGRKKVTFDLNVKVYEELAAQGESNGDLPVERSDEEQEREEDEEEEVKAAKDKESQCHSESSSSSSLLSFPPNSYRYQNCRDSDDEFDESVSEGESDHDYMGDDDDDDDDDEGETELLNNDHLPDSSEDSRKQKLATETLEEEVNSPIPSKIAQVDDAKRTGLNEDESDRIRNLDSVLNPVENLTQWKAIKAHSKLASQNNAKENKISGGESDIPISEEPTLKPPVKKSDKGNSAQLKYSHQEIAVDTSLSTWLAGPEAATPNKSQGSSVSVGNSPCSERSISPRDFEDRPILGALTLEEIRQFSAASSTPRRSPSRSPDDMPIIGSVGSYWSPTGQGSGSFCRGISSTRSKYVEGRRLNFNPSTPFEKRLERTLQKGAVQPY